MVKDVVSLLTPSGISCLLIERPWCLISFIGLLSYLKEKK
jgi:hypothetical protein